MTELYISSQPLTIYQLEILEVIKEMLEENRAAMKCSGTNSDYLDGRNCALRELLAELGIASWEETCD
jgi:hypothetical protein